MISMHGGFAKRSEGLDCYNINSKPDVEECTSEGPNPGVRYIPYLTDVIYHRLPLPTTRSGITAHHRPLTPELF